MKFTVELFETRIEESSAPIDSLTEDLSELLDDARTYTDTDYFYVAHIGDYEFDIDDIVGYSKSTKTVLEKIMRDDNKYKLELFYEFSKSHKRDILKKEGIDLDSILRDFQIENSNKKKTIEQLMTLEATAISQSTL